MTRSDMDAPLPVVVGVDGTDDSARGLRYAVHEAQRRSCGLRLVHATSESSIAVPMLPLVAFESLLEVGHRMVDEAAALVAEIDPDLEVTTEVVPGARGAALAAAGRSARMVVLGHRHLPGLERVLRHSTTHGAVAHATCPVVSVPASWRPESPHGVVLVGVDDSRAAQDALAAGFAEAAVRRSRLEVLHAWRLPLGYDDMIATRIGDDGWRESSKRHLEGLVDPWRELYPEVEARVVVVHDDPAHALAAASDTADLAIVGRSGRGGSLGFHVGGIARSLLRVADCPVEVVPERSFVGRENDPRLDASESSPQT